MVRQVTVKVIVGTAASTMPRRPAEGLRQLAAHDGLDGVDRGVPGSGVGSRLLLVGHGSSS